MTRNTKEISLIQIRTGDLANLPKALHQSEFGLAKDVNRLFIGNAINTYLANRTSDFPYQNLEVLTEFSDLKDYFKYSYENNIQTVNGEHKRSDYKEYLPIVVNCERANPIIPNNCKIKINGVEVSFLENDDLNNIIDKINEVSDETHTYATKIVGTQTLTLICFLSSLYVEDVDSQSIVNDELGFPSSFNANILMPIRKVTEKLDDFLNITDFGISGDGQTNNCDKIFHALIEVYKNFDDSQFYRNILFPAGTYNFDVKNIEGTSSYVHYPFPLISNLMVHGEGIDRTIIKAENGYTKPLLNCVDDTLNILDSSTDYGKNKNYPSNIVIEDMTFESGVEICKLSSISNVTFNRVKFKCNGNSTLVEILGEEGYESSNVTFNECIFEGGDRSIFIPEYAKNINITNCHFTKSYNKAIEIGEELGENPVYGINLSSNTFTNCFTSASSDRENVIIKLGKNAQYVSIHQSIFDKRVIEREEIDGVVILPYKDVDEPNRRNFIDTLDPSTDTKKILRFNFTQPQWEFLNYLCNANGEVVLAVDGKDEDITSTNGLNITQDENGLNIKSVGEGNVIISQHNDSDLILGQGTDGNSNGRVVLNKTLHVNDNKISNDNGTTNIVFQPASNTYLEIEPNSLTNTPYEQTILGHDNAIPNVAYVENAAATSILLRLNLDALKNNFNSESGSLNIITFDKETYGENVYLKNISINVKHPFYQSYKFKSKAIDYTEGHTYYRGDVVKGTNESGNEVTYGVVKNTHVASSTFYDALNVENKIVELKNDNLSDISYIDVMATDGQNDILSLTKKYNVDYAHIENDDFVFSANISAINNFNLKPLEFDNSKIFGDANYLVKHQDKVFVVKKGEKDENENYPQIQLTALDLRDTTIATKKYSEGYNYIYDMDRTMLIDNQPIDLSAKNFSDMTLYVTFGNANGEQVYAFDDYTQLCPSGEAIIRIDYIKKEVK